MTVEILKRNHPLNPAFRQWLGSDAPKKALDIREAKRFLKENRWAAKAMKGPTNA